MAKIIPNDLIKGITGKVCGHSDQYYSMNKTSGVIHTGKRCNPYEGPLTEKQLAQQQKFAKQARATAAWLRENRPNPDVAGDRGTEVYRQVQSLKKGLGKSSITQVLKMFMNMDNYSISIPGYAKWVYTEEADSATQPETPVPGTEPEGGNTQPEGGNTQPEGGNTDQPVE